jgi:uncharacterized protein (TIGR03435 family)
MNRTISVAVLATVAFIGAAGQTVNKAPAFEVADIKPSDPARGGPGKERLLPGGRIELPGVTVMNLIMVSYGVQENMISGAPKWAATERFDIVAKAGENTPIPTLALMMQSLLAERFQLAIHREEKVMPAYVLTVGKRALKLREGNGGRQSCNWTTLDSGLARRTCQNLSMAELARQLPGWAGVGIELPVVDQTGLKSAYDFELEVGMRRREGGRGGDGEARGASAVIADSGPTIFSALDQVGLKLESRKMPLAVVVVDRVERPN